MTRFLTLWFAIINWAVATSCTVSSLGVNFGLYNNADGLPTSSTGTVSVRCQSPIIGLLINYQISFNSGNGTIPQRKMRNGSSELNYNLYRNSGFTSILGDSIGQVISGGMLLSLLNIPITNNHTIYANIPPGQPAIPGIYTDVITMTVTF